jgi:hypothetical protein
MRAPACSRSGASPATNIAERLKNTRPGIPVPRPGAHGDPARL